MGKLTVLCVLMLTGTAQAEPYSETFAKITGITPGLYRLVKGPSSCYDGDLVLKDKVSKLDKNVRGIAFVLNSHPLASFLGGRDKGKEPGFVWNIESSVTSSRVEYSKTGTFKGEPVSWSLVVIPRPDGFTYTTEIDGESVTCEVAR